MFFVVLGKSQALYEKLLRVVMQQCDDLTVSADPHTAITDFELAVMNAAANFLGPQVEVQGCLKHKYKKIQDLGLAQSYCDSKDVKHFCCMIDALAFLPVDQVSDGMQYLFSNPPKENHDTLSLDVIIQI